MNEKVFNSFKRDLKDLLQKYNVIIGVELEGDTHFLAGRFVMFEGLDERGQTLKDSTFYINSSDL